MAGELPQDFDPKNPWAALKGQVIFEARADSLGNIIINGPSLTAQQGMIIALNIVAQIMFSSFEAKSSLIVKPYMG